MNRSKVFFLVLALVGLILAGGSSLLAVQPDAKTVPFVPTNPLIPHSAFDGESTVLKGTSSVFGPTIQYTWDFGDGGPPVSGVVTSGNQYALEATHTYAGPDGQVFTAILTVEDTSTGQTDSANYFVQVRDRPSVSATEELEVEVNIAIDMGLWYLHKTMSRTGTPATGTGLWITSDPASPTAANVNAFGVQGHKEGLDPVNDPNPYAETVARGLRFIFSRLVTNPVGPQTNPDGTFTPDGNSNGVYTGVQTGSAPLYQNGMIMDAIVSTGTPTAVASTGPANVIGETYADIVQDIVDSYAYCQYDGIQGGGWRYSCNQFPDNSACQWGAIGLIAAEREFGNITPPEVRSHNIRWLNFSQNPTTGVFGYTSSSPIWGPYATTPSGMVQMAWVGIGRGDARWDKAETFMRDNFGNSGSWSTNPRSYTYGLFSFTKSMLLHDSNADGTAEPLNLLQSQTVGVPPVDWYGAQVGDGDPLDGVARTLVNQQQPSGQWSVGSPSGQQNWHHTGWAVTMLTRTVVTPTPVAVAGANPNPAVAGQTVNLDGSASFHLDPVKSIVQWEWDLDDDGTFDVSGPTAATSFPVVGDYPVTLRVTDNVGDTDSTVVTVRVTTPPVAPTADANGPYSFCPQAQPWFLDGTGSVNPDEGVSEPGQPGDTIQSYDWELPGGGSATGPTPDVTGFFSALGTGSYLVQLTVTDTTAISFPSIGQDLSDVDSAQVSVRAGTDPDCACVNDLTARPKRNKIQLVWTHTGAASYNVYRSTTSGGPYTLIANTTSTYSTYLDTAVTAGTTYYYVVREVAANTNELCQSNEASVTLSASRR